MLKTRMYWLEERQKLLAENVANADSPGYRGRDLKQLDFNAALRSTASVTLAATAPGHFGAGGDTQFAPALRGGFEPTSNGNAVVLEEEMMKVAENQAEYQKTLNLYRKMITLFKTAIGTPGG